MRILLNLVGVVLAVAFLGYMAIILNDTALYVVTIIGIVLMLWGVRQDEQQEDSRTARLSEME